MWTLIMSVYSLKLVLYQVAQHYVLNFKQIRKEISLEKNLTR